LGDVLAELAVALLRPDPEVFVEIERPERLDDRPARGIDDGPQPGPANRDERVAEVERDRADAAGLERGHVATLDGQISRYGQ
jgi:hypothetical protein